MGNSTTTTALPPDENPGDGESLRGKTGNLSKASGDFTVVRRSTRGSKEASFASLPYAGSEKVAAKSLSVQTSNYYQTLAYDHGKEEGVAKADEQEAVANLMNLGKGEALHSPDRYYLVGG